MPAPGIPSPLVEGHDEPIPLRQEPLEPATPLVVAELGGPWHRPDREGGEDRGTTKADPAGHRPALGWRTDPRSAVLLVGGLCRFWSFALQGERAPTLAP